MGMTITERCNPVPFVIVPCIVLCRSTPSLYLWLLCSSALEGRLGPCGDHGGIGDGGIGIDSEYVDCESKIRVDSLFRFACICVQF